MLLVTSVVWCGGIGHNLPFSSWLSVSVLISLCVFLCFSFLLASVWSTPIAFTLSYIPKHTYLLFPLGGKSQLPRLGSHELGILLPHPLRVLPWHACAPLGFGHGNFPFLFGTCPWVFYPIVLSGNEALGWNESCQWFQVGGCSPLGSGDHRDLIRGCWNEGETLRSDVCKNYLKEPKQYSNWSWL